MEATEREHRERMQPDCLPIISVAKNGVKMRLKKTFIRVKVLYNLQSTKNFKIEKIGAHQEPGLALFLSLSDFERLVIGPREARNRTLSAS